MPILQILLKRIFLFITDVLQVLRKNFPVAISIGALYLIFGVADQGQDMLININSYDLGPVTLYFMLTVLALIHWQFPKFFSEKALQLPKFSDIFFAEFSSTTNPLDNYRIVPRLLGVATFLVPAYSILLLLPKYSVAAFGKWYQWLPGFFLLGSLLLFGLILHYNLVVKFYEWLKSKGWKNAFAGICILLAASPLFFWPLNYSLPSDQVYLFWGWFCYAILFALLTSTRWSLAKDFPVKFVRVLLEDKSLTPIIWGLSFFAVLFFCFS